MTTENDAPWEHDFLPVKGHPDDDECTYRSDGTDATYCGRPAAEHHHHPNCYQSTGEIPDDLPDDLCDCRILHALQNPLIGPDGFTRLAGNRVIPPDRGGEGLMAAFDHYHVRILDTADRLPRTPWTYDSQTEARSRMLIEAGFLAKAEYAIESMVSYNTYDSIRLTYGDRAVVVATVACRRSRTDCPLRKR